MFLRLKKWLRMKADNSNFRINWIESKLAQLSPGKIIDVGAGSQRYRMACRHLEYFAQDFGQSSEGLGTDKYDYLYGPIDFKSNCWEIAANSESFDHALCSEVLEHIPYPKETIAEISRLLKPGGYLILTVPSHSLRHMDPYFFFPGFSDRYLEKFLPENNLEIIELKPVGNYFSWMQAEMLRTVAFDRKAAIALFPAYLYFALKEKFSTSSPNKFDNLLAEGYFVLARKK